MQDITQNQPTSPWTELYQPNTSAEDDKAACHFYESDEQQPTHDALSDIYNPKG